jgi:hypothetical protein
LRTLYLDIQSDQIENFADLLGTPASATFDATGQAETQRVPFFNVRELIIRTMDELSTAGFEALLLHGFPSLERLDVADDFDDNELAAIFNGTAPLVSALSGVILT